MARPSNLLAQIGVVTRLNLQTIFQRRGSAVAAMFGIAGVVAVLVGVLSIAQGFRRTMTVSGAPDRAIVLRAGSDSEMMSVLSRDDVRIIRDAPGLAASAQGPLASCELFVIINLPKRSTGTDANVPLRGVSPEAFEVRGSIQMLSGRRFEPGRNEAIVGRGALEEFAGLDLGSKLTLGQNEWSVVGIFASGGGIAESEIWTDYAVLQPAYRRGSTVQSVYARLVSAGAFEAFKDALTDNPQINVRVVRESEFLADQSKLLYAFITGLGVLVAGLMGVGAIFGALNTMYTAVSSRTREIATLRALGFRSGPVIASVLIESMILAAVGGVAGGGAAYLAFDGFRAATINWQSFSQVAFAFAVTPGLLIQGIVYAMVLGFIGGLFPAIRAARLPVAGALRDL